MAEAQAARTLLLRQSATPDRAEPRVCPESTLSQVPTRRSGQESAKHIAYRHCVTISKFDITTPSLYCGGGGGVKHSGGLVGKRLQSVRLLVLEQLTEQLADFRLCSRQDTPASWRRSVEPAHATSISVLRCLQVALGLEAVEDRI